MTTAAAPATGVVTPEQIADAMAIVEAACREAGLHPAMSVRPYFDPEECGPGVMMIEARFAEDIEVEPFMQLLGAIDQRLYDAGLIEPNPPISFDLVGPW
jgi:hypothetical protein